MSTMHNSIQKMSFEEFLLLPEEDVHYELNEGELLVTPSPTPYHNTVGLRIAQALTAFVKTHLLGAILCETDFRLGANTVRKPDVAFVTAQQLKSLDVHRSPVEGAPTLAVEVISPSNSAQDILVKVHQYLDTGCKAVWVVYPILSLVAMHDAHGMREAKGSLEEERIFGEMKFSLPLADVFNEDIAQ